MDVSLTLIEGGKTVTVRPRLPTVIGRNTEADMQVPDSQVSRRHCELYEYEGKLAVRDVGSVNGTQVNGHKIEQDTFLSTGDTLGVGRVTFRVEVTEVDPEAFPPGAEPAAASAADSGVVMVESEDPEPAAHSESAVLNYESSGEGSFIGISDGDVADDSAGGDSQDDDDGLGDFLKGLG